MIHVGIKKEIACVQGALFGPSFSNLNSLRDRRVKWHVGYTCFQLYSLSLFSRIQDAQKKF